MHRFPAFKTGIKRKLRILNHKKYEMREAAALNYHFSPRLNCCGFNISFIWGNARVQS